MSGIQILDQYGNPFARDGEINKALRVTSMPRDYGSGGSYSMTFVNAGPMAAGLVANSEIFHWRWTDATKLCVIQEILFEGAANAGTAFAVGVARVEALVARAWTINGTGGTVLTPFSGNVGKLRTDMPDSKMGSSGYMAIATTTALGIGTKVLDSLAIGACLQGITAAAGIQVIPNNPLFQPDQLHPLVLEANEGFAIRASVPATGTWTFGITVRWSELELDAY